MFPVNSTTVSALNEKELFAIIGGNNPDADGSNLITGTDTDSNIIRDDIFLRG